MGKIITNTKTYILSATKPKSKLFWMKSLKRLKNNQRSLVTEIHPQDSHKDNRISDINYNIEFSYLNTSSKCIHNIFTNSLTQFMSGMFNLPWWLFSHHEKELLNLVFP